MITLIMEQSNGQKRNYIKRNYPFKMSEQHAEEQVIEAFRVFDTVSD
jgi:hypothetical protein